MLIYDHQRTEEIVARLRKADAVMRQINRVLVALPFSFLIGQMFHDLSGAQGGGKIAATWCGWFLGLAIGWSIIGPFVARSSMYLFSPVLEWMCQLLIAQGSIAESLRQRNP